MYAVTYRDCEQLLALRKDKRWRRGLVQGFGSCGVISNEQAMILLWQIKAGMAEPRVDVGWPRMEKP